MITSIIVILLILLIIWISLDFILGSKSHRALVPPKEVPIYRQSRVKFFSHGDKMFDHLLERIDEAKSQLHINFYIFRDDSIGQKFLTKLKEKSRQGVTVRLMADWVGMAISRNEQRSLKQAGVQVAKANRPSFPFIFYTLNKRNHRKICVIDGKYSYVGGFNIGDEYLGRDKKKGRWRDFHLFIEGEAVEDLQRQFLMDWQEAAKETIGSSETMYPALTKGPTTMRIFPSNGKFVEETVYELLDQAETSVYIGTPYFIPGKALKNKLISIANKGVNVKILIPKYPDHPLVKDAAFPYFYDLLQAGIDIRQFYEGFYHSKGLIIDEKIIDIGTSNFDQRSFHSSKEVNCIIEDPAWIKPVKEEIEKDFYESAEQITLEHISKRTFFDRGKERVATLLAPLL